MILHIALRDEWERAVCSDTAYLPGRFTRDPGSAETFPHVYGSIELAAVARVIAFPPGPDGRFSFPDLGA